MGAPLPGLPGQDDALAGALLALAPLFLFAGRPLLDIALALGAGVWGLGLTTWVLQSVLPPSAPAWLPPLAGLVVGIALAFAVDKALRFGYFLLGAGCGALAGNALAHMCLSVARSSQENIFLALQITLVAVCSVGLGGAFVGLKRPFAMLSTSFLGGFMLIAVSPPPYPPPLATLSVPTPKLKCLEVCVTGKVMWADFRRDQNIGCESFPLRSRNNQGAVLLADDLLSRCDRLLLRRSAVPRTGCGLGGRLSTRPHCPARAPLGSPSLGAVRGWLRHDGIGGREFGPHGRGGSALKLINVKETRKLLVL